MTPFVNLCNRRKNMQAVALISSRPNQCMRLEAPEIDTSPDPRIPR